MFSTSDTIVALATPSGRGGLGVVRLSGPDAHEIARGLIGRQPPLEPRHATLARVAAADISDRVVVTYFPRPHSYTTEDVVEVSAHGSPVVLQHIVRAAIERGARLARPGEFTFRAFLNGRLDLTQAEAVSDLIEAVTPSQAAAASAQLDGALASRLRALDATLFDLIARLEASLDFPDEGYHFIDAQSVSRALDGLRADVDRLLAPAAQGRLIREGARVVLLGRPNTGKSSIFNALCRSERAIVTAVPGTTRDVIVEAIAITGVPVTLVDTAGLRDTIDEVEREGVMRASAAATVADLVLAVFDVSAPLEPHDDDLLRRTAGRPRIVVSNKCDRPRAWDPASLCVNGSPLCETSALSGEGIEGLVRAIGARLGAAPETIEGALVTNTRHIDLLRRCAAAFARAQATQEARGGQAPEEVLLVDLNDAREALDEIAGRRTSEDVLERIFERFCIGK
jgi:tRNA modification GTPase